MTAALTRVIGIGQPAAGDDGVGIAVARALRECPLPAGLEIYETTDPGRLIELLDGIRHAILIDALAIDANPGTVKCLAPEELAAYPSTPVSSHGIGVAEAVGIARALAPDGADVDIRIIGVTIRRSGDYSEALSAPAAAAVPRAAGLILDLLEGSGR